MNAARRAPDLVHLSFSVKDSFRASNYRRRSSRGVTCPSLTRHGRFLTTAIPGEVEPSTSLSSGNGSVQTETESFLIDLDRGLNLLPEKIRASVLNHEEYEDLIELIMDYGRKPIARFPSGNFVLTEELVNDEDLANVEAVVGGFDDSNRAGLEGTLHRISCIRDRDFGIRGLTIRIGRAVTAETAKLVEEPLREGQSILLIGPPGIGKTSAIRNFCKMLSETCKKHVVIVDTSSEIAGPGKTPHPAVGDSRSIPVRSRADQHNEMIKAVQNHTPEVIVIDEIGTSEECLAAKSIARRGVQLLATTHARTLEDVVKDPVLRDLVGGVSNVILGDERAFESKRHKKIIRERIEASSFDVVVEMEDKTRWRIHYNANKAVDAILASRSVEAKIRYLDEVGNMVVKKEDEEKTLSAIETAERILNASSNYDVLQVEVGVSREQLKETFKRIYAKVAKTENEDDLVNESRKRVLKAYRELISSTETSVTIPLKDARLTEAERIINASSDLEILQVKAGASKKELKVALQKVSKKVVKTKDEDKIMNEARRLVLEAYTRLLPPTKTKKEEIGKKTRSRRRRIRKKTNSSARNTTNGT